MEGIKNFVTGAITGAKKAVRLVLGKADTSGTPILE